MALSADVRRLNNDAAFDYLKNKSNRNQNMPRGGKRDGAGRRAGVPSVKTIARKAIADKAAAEGVTPLEVMLANMRHFHKLAESAEAALTELSADKIAELPPDKQFEYLLAEVKKAAGLRDMAQGCARDASPYLHPKLAAIAHEHTGKDGGPIVVTDEQRVKALHALLAKAGKNGE